MRLTLASIALCFALLFSLFQVGLVAAPTQDDMGSGSDAGNTIDTATTISAGSGTGYIDSSDAYDYYKVSVSSGQSISVSVTPPSGSDFDLYLYDPSQEYADSSSSGGSTTDTVTCTATSSGYFYIKVYQWDGSGTYSMTVTITGGGVSTQNDMGSGDDAGNSLSVATLIPAGSGTGYIDSTDTDDYYKVSVSSGQTVSVSMTPPSGSDFDIRLYGTDQSEVDSSTYSGSQTDSVEETATASGYFYIRVYQYSGSGSYSMTVTVTGSGTTQNDFGTGTDAGNSLSAATLIAAGSGTGYIDSTDTYDYYKISVSSGQTVNVSLTPPSGSDFDIELYDTDQSQVDSSTYGGSATDTVEGTATASGYFYIYVYQWSGSGIYSMTVTVTGSGATQNDMGTGTDAGNSLSAAAQIAANTSGTGYIDTTDTHDYYKVSVTSGQLVSVSITPPSGSDFDLRLYDTNQSQVDSSTYGGSTTDTVEGTATSSGHFYIDVYQYSGSGVYSMIVTVTGGTVQNDMGTGTDAGDTISEATTIPTGSGTGYIDTTDTHDYYKVSVTSGQVVNVSITPPSGSDFDVKLYDTNQSQIDSSSYGGSTTDEVEGTATASGYFYIDVYQYSGSGIYSMIITVTGGTTQDDMGTGMDAGNSLSAATTIPAGTGTGYIDDTDTDDYYKVSVSSGQTVSVSMTPPSPNLGGLSIQRPPDFDLELYDTSQSQVGSSSLGGSQTDAVEGMAASSGYFYIHVYQWSGSGIYSMTVTVTGGTAQNDMSTGTDAGNSLSAATTIPAGTGTGYLDDTDPADYYKVDISTGQTISVDLTPPSGSDFDLTLYDSSLSYVDSSAYGGSQTDSVTGTATASGYFYVYVEQWSGSGIYSLTVTVTGGTAQNDMGTGTDAGNTISAATAIPAGSGTGYIDSTDTADYYKVSVNSGQTVGISMTPPSGSDFDIKLYDTSQSQIDSSTYGGSATDIVEGTATASGYFYIYVYQYSGQGIYSMTVTVSGTAVATQNDWNSSQDAGDSFAQALTISTGTGTGYVDSTDTDDYYKINAGQGSTISASLTPPSGSDFDLYLYSPSQTEVDESILGSNQTDTVQYDATSAGIHYVRVHSYSGEGTYTLNVSLTSAGALAESAHPYANNFGDTWTITRSGAGRIRAHFTQLDAENNWDYVYIYDENNNLIESYTGSYRDRWTGWVDGSSIIIGLSTDGSVEDYGFTVDRVETGAAVPVTPSNNVAVIAGVNDYQRINDLRYAVNDAQDWRNYLVGKGYTISSFMTNSQATEANIRAAITNAANAAGSNGTLVLIFSGHGTDGSPGDAHAYCCYDAGNTGTGYLTGTELRDLLSGYNGKLFVFFDSCYSGGMNQSVTNTKQYMTTTCTNDGYGYDESSYSNGAWTYWYLERGLIGQSFTTAEQAFDWASARYPYGGGDAPQEFDGDASAAFNI